MPRDEGHTVALTSPSSGVAPTDPRDSDGQLVKVRGGSVVYKFVTTEGMTNEALLTIGERKMALFLMVTLVDAQGQLSTAVDAVLHRWGQVEGHWASKVQRKTLQSCCGKIAGKGAEPSSLRWEKVRDFLIAVGREDVLPEAAWLFCEATGVAEPEQGWLGEKRRPAWDRDDTTGVFTSFQVGGRAWAQRFWLDSVVDAMLPADPVTAPPVQPLTTREPHADGDADALRAIIKRLRAQLDEQRADFQDRLRAGDQLAVGISLELVKSLDENTELKKERDCAERTLAERGAELQQREHDLSVRRAEVERAEAEQAQFQLRVEQQASERIRQLQQEAHQQVWEIRRDRQEVVKERDNLLDENLKLRKGVWSLREDVLRQLKERNPTASQENLLRLLDDMLPPGITIEDLVPDRARDSTNDVGTPKAPADNTRVPGDIKPIFGSKDIRDANTTGNKPVLDRNDLGMTSAIHQDDAAEEDHDGAGLKSTP